MSEPAPEVSLPIDPGLKRNLGLDRGARLRRASWIAGGAVALVAAAAGGYAGYRHLTREPPTEYQVATVRVADIEATVEASGSLEPVRRVEVGPEVSGRIVAVHADFNARVTQGQVLIEIDPLPIEAQRREARARLAIARAGLRRATVTRAGLRRATVTRDDAARTLRRYAPLAGTGAISERERDAAEAAVAQAEVGIADARAQITLAEASLASIETSLERTTIRSPIDGIVLERAAEVGQPVAAAFQPPVLFVLAEDLARMELQLSVDEADIGRVAEGQHATFTVDAFPSRTFEGRVTSVRNAPRTLQGVVTYEVIVQVSNDEHLLRPGMTANARVVTASTADALVVPGAALRFTPPGHPAASDPTVWVRGDGEIRAVEVERGIDDTENVVVRGALHPGDEVLVDVIHPER